MSTGITSFVYRNRADGVKNIASTTADNVNRRLLLEIAADYEQIAETLDRINAMESVIRKRADTSGRSVATGDGLASGTRNPS
jgi:hypothetical protein